MKWNDKWYLFDSVGKMLTGWQQNGGNWYYLGENGDMKTGWVKSGNLWYYCNPNRAARRAPWSRAAGLRSTARPIL